MEKRVTCRGFAYGEFKDSYGIKCSIQKSSAACDDYIWLGIDDVECKVMASKHRELAEKRTDVKPSERFNGWVEYPLPDDCSIVTRMHLSQEKAATLATELAYFAKYGELMDSDTDWLDVAQALTELTINED